MDSTRERLLDAAEHLFSDEGYGASLRSITSAAEANLAAVSYHFGSKEDLLLAVVMRRIGGANEWRLQELDRLEARGDVTLEELVEIFLRPALEVAADTAGGGARFMRLIGRIHGDPDGPWRRVMASGAFDEVRDRFTAALARVLPELDQSEVLWRLHLTVGAMVHTLVNPEILIQMSGGACDPRDAQRTLAQLVPFLSAGFRAASAQKGEQ